MFLALLFVYSTRVKFCLCSLPLGLNNIYSVIEIIHTQKYTLSCKTGSDSKLNAYLGVRDWLRLMLVALFGLFY